MLQKIFIFSSASFCLAFTAFAQADPVSEYPFWLIATGIVLGGALFIGACYSAFIIIDAVFDLIDSIFRYIVGLIAFVTSWTMFLICTVIWLPLTVCAALTSFIAGLIFSGIWPPYKRCWELWSLAEKDEPSFVSTLLKYSSEEEPYFTGRRRSLRQESIKSLENDYGTLATFSNELAVLNVSQQTQLMNKYLETTKRLQTGFDSLEVEQLGRPYWDDEFYHPGRALGRVKYLHSEEELFEQPIEAVRFLVTYALVLPVWMVRYPFSIGKSSFQTAIFSIHFSMRYRTNRKLQCMKDLLSEHRKSIEDIIRGFGDFQSEQQSVHQQTKALRDEMIEELDKVKTIAKEYHDEAKRLREYVNLVKSRSDQMDANNPLAEIKSLLSEIRGTRAQGE